ncbi:Helitron helicase-like protein [Gracilaria domingensis]|nr:Helitron helicase-like protein [Gracilaria domingensis]
MMICRPQWFAQVVRVAYSNKSAAPRRTDRPIRFYLATQPICLRLPSIFVYRSQGGFGQTASKGAHVSFSNPVSDLAKKLPRHGRMVFKFLIESATTIEISSKSVRNVLFWLQQKNPLYKDIELEEDAFEDIDKLNSANDPGSSFKTVVPGEALESPYKSSTSVTEARVDADELRKERQGSIDIETIEELSKRVTTGIDDSENAHHCRLLVHHMLRPFSHRRNHVLPSYDASEHLESYFPVLFPYGRGGPKTIGCHLGLWTKVVLSVYRSRFVNDLEFIFFIHSVLKRKRITGLCTHAPLRGGSNHALMEVRELLSSSLPSTVIARRIDSLVRSGTLSASFEALRGSPAFWACLKRKSWAYLTRFGPCQLFVTMSAADVKDPHVYCEADDSLSIERARDLTATERADILASNPVAAVTN